MKPTMKKPCVNCPFLKTNEWKGGEMAKTIAFEQVHRQKKFACHMKNPNAHVFSLQDMVNDDCAGFRMLKENVLKPNRHPKVVNGFNETQPRFDLMKWWFKNSNDITMLEYI